MTEKLVSISPVVFKILVVYMGGEGSKKFYKNYHNVLITPFAWYTIT